MSGGGQGSTGNQSLSGFGGGFGQSFGLGGGQPSYGFGGSNQPMPSQNYNAYAPNFGGQYSTPFAQSFYNQGPSYQSPMYQTPQGQAPQQLGSLQNATAKQLQGFINDPSWQYDDTTGGYVNPNTGAYSNTQPIQPANIVDQQSYTKMYRPSNEYQGKLNSNQYYQPIYQQQYQNYYSPYYSQMGAGNGMGMYNNMAQYGYNPYSSFNPYTNSFGGQGYGLDSLINALAPYFNQSNAGTTGTTSTTGTTGATTTGTTGTTGTAGTTGTTGDKSNLQYISDGAGGLKLVDMGLQGNTNSTTAGYLADGNLSATDISEINKLLGSSTDAGKDAIYNTLSQFGVSKDTFGGLGSAENKTPTLDTSKVTNVTDTGTKNVTNAGTTGTTGTTDTANTGLIGLTGTTGTTNTTPVYAPQYYDPDTGENVDYDTGRVRNPVPPVVAPTTNTTAVATPSPWQYDDTTGGYVNPFTGAWSATDRGAKTGGLMSLLRK